MSSNPDPRFEPPERTGVALLSAEFLLGVIVGAAVVFVGFGVFGFHAGNPVGGIVDTLPSRSPSPSPRATATPVPSVTPSPTPPPTPPPTPRETPSPTPTAVPTETGTPLLLPSTSVPESTIAGTWTVTTGSSAGYRVTIHIPFLGVSQVHATTQAISGHVDIATSAGIDAITAADVSGDLRGLRSGNSLLDRQVALVLQTDRFPMSEFRLTQPAVLPFDRPPGVGMPVTLHGDLTLQGVSRTVDLPATLRQTAAGLTLVGAVDFLLSQFGISNQVGGGFATVDDATTFEFSLQLIR